MSRTLLATATLFALGLMSGVAVADEKKITIPELIQRVKANEQLYENLDISITSNYADHSQTAPPPADKGAGLTSPGSTFIVYRGKKTTLHSVRQGHQFRVDREGKATTPDDSFGLDRTRAFDGKVTRLVDQKSIGNIIQGRSEDELLVRPHMLLLSFMQWSVDLSTYMSGHEAMRVAEKSWGSGLTLEVEYLGREMFKDLSCQRISITTLVGGKKANDRWELWLAEDRNYLPICMKGFTHRFSKSVPISEGYLQELREIEPGIWLPNRIQITAYQPAKLTEGTQVKQWEYSDQVSHASLKPQYPDSYFRDIEFPKGMPVYELSDGGKITTSYTVGAPSAPPPQAAWLKLWQVLAASLLLALAVALLVFQFRRKSATSSTAKTDVAQQGETM